MNRDYSNIKEMLYGVTSKYADKNAFIDITEDGDLFYKTYGDLISEIECLGTGLEKLGLNKNKIVIIGKNRYNWALSFLTSMCDNGLTIPLDKELTDLEIKNCINRVEAETIIYSSEFEERLNDMKDDLTIKNFISMDKSNGLNIHEIMALGKEELSKGNRDYIDKKIDNDKEAELLFTSGTTSESKIVMISNFNIINNVLNAKKMIKITDKDTFLSLLPLHHTFENTCGLITPLCSGSTIGYNDSLKNIVKNIDRMKPTVILVVPRFIEVFHEKIIKGASKKGKLELVNKIVKTTSNIKNMNFLKKKLFKDVHKEFGGKLRLFIVGGASVEPKISKYMRGLGFSVLQGYGLTECSPMVAINKDNKFRDDAVGLAVPGTEIVIHNKDKDGIGEIKVKGNQVMKGYYKNEKATKEAIKEDGFFYTGDLGSFDKDNFLSIKGRCKNLIIASNGKNIYPEELEEIINKSSLVRESMVYSVNENSNKLNLTVDVVLTDEIVKKISDNEKYKEEIETVMKNYIKEVNDILPEYKRINNINILEHEFEKTTTLKIKRYKK